jgi:GDPmannose 4,6-dehydratase
LFACNGILFNHESPVRGETFVTRKITRAAARISLGLQRKLYVGNLDCKRDWGHAKDYVLGMWLILQQDKPDDFVLATGKTHTVREFAELAFKEAGVNLEWNGQGINEKGINRQSGENIIEVDTQYFRPAEVDILLGDPSKACNKLGWKYKYSFAELIKDMVEKDILEAKRDIFLKEKGYKFFDFYE